jgi:hypothetical protein
VIYIINRQEISARDTAKGERKLGLSGLADPVGEYLRAWRNEAGEFSDRSQPRETVLSDRENSCAS